MAKVGGKLARSGYSGIRLPMPYGRHRVELARRMGYDQSSLWLVWMGKRPITRQFVDALCSATGLAEEQLFIMANGSEQQLASGHARLAGVAD